MFGLLMSVFCGAAHRSSERVVHLPVAFLARHLGLVLGRAALVDALALLVRRGRRIEPAAPLSAGSDSRAELPPEVELRFGERIFSLAPVTHPLRRLGSDAGFAFWPHLQSHQQRPLSLPLSRAWSGGIGTLWSGAASGLTGIGASLREPP